MMTEIKKKKMIGTIYIRDGQREETREPPNIY